MKPAMHAQLSQTTLMTPQLLQSIRLLQLSTLELEQELRQSIDSNVMLEEVAPGDDEDDSGEEEIHDDSAMPEASEADTPVSGCDAAAGERIEIDRDHSNSEPWSGGEPGEDGEPLAERTAAPQSGDARVRALEQLQLIVNTAREAQLVGAILEAIDDNGYLECTLEELGVQLDADAEEMEAALRLVQSVEPSGFGARDLGECLQLQLRALPAGTPGRSLAKHIVLCHLAQLGASDMSELRASLGVSANELGQAVSLILSLDPKPGAATLPPAQVAVPDVIVSGEHGGWRVELNAATLPRVRINSTYERLLNHAPAHRAMRDQLQEARWLVRGVEMRHDTLLRTARAIFERQREFLRRGEEGMAPLTLREIADAIGMHESTVCRVTTSKYVQTPWGIYELKAFFPSQLGRVEGETSGTAVRAMIRRIIDAESGNAPLCDGAIAALLHRAGVRVARRTVAKYREAMKIAPAKERRTARPRLAARMAG